MQVRRWHIWLGAATMLAASVLVPMLIVRHDDAPPHASAEPDLFAFLRQMEQAMPAQARHFAAGGALAVDAELERLFGHFISAGGEHVPAAMNADLERQIVRYFDPAVVPDARRLFERYLGYRQALQQAEGNLHGNDDPVAQARQRLDLKRAVRARFFSDAESRGLFGIQDAGEADALARLEIARDTSLDDRQKQEQLAALSAGMPPALRDAQEAPQKATRLEEAVRISRADGADDEHIFRMRAETFSPEVAARMAQADQREKLWQDRIGAYLAERSRLLDDPGLPYARRATALQELRDAHFSQDEQRLISAYE